MEKVNGRKNKTPILYLFLYDVLNERFKYNRMTTPSYIIEVLKKRFWYLPKMVCYEILDEMEGYNLVKRINHKSYYIVPNRSVKRLQQLTNSPLWSWLF